jgi:sulfatase modifying factor 1
VACTDCARQFGVEASSAWPVSFGVANDGTTLRVRGRLFRASLIGPDGTPQSAALIDRTVSLPATTTDLHVSLVLPMSCFGVPAQPGAALSCDPDTGMLAPEPVAPLVTAGQPTVGSWPPAATVDCPSAAPAGMTCIAGGAFLLGDPVTPPVEGAAGVTTPEHLVTLSPFYLDDHELTVAEYTALKAANPSLPVPAAQGASVTDGQFCTYQGSDSGMPLTCLSHPSAVAICAAQGKRLPTEAEWEYAAGNTNEETPFPWGTDSNVCKYAVVARGGFAGASLCQVGTGTAPEGPVAGGLAGDVTVLGVQNLGGNVSEWVDDAFAGYTDSCWADSPSPANNPECMTSPYGTYAVRGGNWTAVPISATASIRGAGSPSFVSGYVGVRCAHDG